MRAEIQMRTGHSFWAKIRQNSDIIDIQALLESYWGSTEHEFTVSSQSQPLTSLLISDREAQRPLPLESTMGSWSCDSLPILPSVSLHPRIAPC